MPIVPLDQAQANLNEGNTFNTIVPQQDLPTPTTPSLTDTFKAAWERNTFTGSLATFGINDNTVTDPTYNAAQKLKDTPYWGYADQAVGVNNDAELQNFKTRIDKENENAQILANSSGLASTVANFGAQLGDVLTYIPFLGIAGKAAALTAKTVAMAGAEEAAKVAAPVAMNAAKGAAQGAAIGGAFVGAQELGIQQTQATRTPQESLLNTATGAVFGSILGGAVGHFTRTTPDLHINSEPAEVVKGVLNTGDSPIIVMDNKSAGAAYTNSFGEDSHIAKMTIKANGKSFEMTPLTQVPYLHAPVLDGLSADSQVLNNVTSSMFEHTLFERKNVVTPEMNETGKFGLSTNAAVDTLQKLDRVDVFDFHREMRNNYLDYADTKPGALAAMRARFNIMGTGKMSFNDMNAAISDAARSGDVHDNPHVTRGAGIVRKYVEKANQQMQKAKVPAWEEIQKNIAETPGLDDSYYPRVYDKQAIVNDRAGFEAVLQKHFESQPDMDALDAQGKQDGTKMSPEQAKIQANKTTDNILGAGEQNVTLSDISRMSLEKGVNFRKQRILGVPSSLVSDYLVNDPMRTISQYLTQASQLSRFQEMLNSFGVESVNDMKVKLYEEGQAKQLALDPKDANYSLNKKNLTNQYLNYQEQLQDNAAILLGQYAKRTKWDGFFRALRTFNYLRLMGRIVINSCTDLAMPILKHGLGATLKGYGQGLRNIFTGNRTLENEMLRHLSVAVDLEMDGALRTIIDPDFGSNLVTRQPKVGTGMGPTVAKLYNDFIYGANIAADRASVVFSNINFINYWNAAGQRLNARVTISRIMKDLHEYNSLPPEEKTYLNSIGIGQKDIKPILKQFEKHGATKQGAYVSDIQEWDNREMAEKFAGAVIQEVDSSIVRPGKGDTPKAVQRSEMGKTLLQFKGFFSTMTSKVLVSALQRHDSNVMFGVLGMLSLGASQYLMVQALNGKQPDSSTENLLLEGLNRSGMLGLLGDPLFGIILNNKMGGGSRYLNQNWIEYMLGPSASLIKTSNKIFNDVKEGKADDKTLKAAETLIPFQNLFYLRLLFDKLNGRQGP